MKDDAQVMPRSHQLCYDFSCNRDTLNTRGCFSISYKIIDFLTIDWQTHDAQVKTNTA